LWDRRFFFTHTILEGESMDTKLFVGNLSYDTSEDDLRTLFSEAGTVSSVMLITDRDTGRSKGFAFIEMGNQSEAEQAIKRFNGFSLGNRELKVDKARPREERSPYRSDDRYGGRGGSRSGGSWDRNRSRNRRSGGGGTRRY
jgi:RNA recognition motif-containing protein